MRRNRIVVLKLTPVAQSSSTEVITLAPYCQVKLVRLFAFQLRKGLVWKAGADIPSVLFSAIELGEVLLNLQQMT